MIPYILLAVVELVCFGVFSSRLGFYHDDWTNLERLANAGGLWQGVKFYTGVSLERPVGMIMYPLLFAMGGLHALRYQVFYLGAEILEGWLLFVLLKRLLGWRDLALLASALIMIFPTHAVTHVWLSSAGMVITINLALTGLIFHHRWIEGRRQSDLWAGQLFYLLAVLNYEIAAFLPLLLAGGLLARRCSDGRPVGEAIHDCVQEFWPYGTSLGAALLWQRAVVSMVLKRNPRLIGFSVVHAFKAYEAGLECIANRATDVCARMMPVAWHGLGMVWVLAGLAFSACWVWFSWYAAKPTEDQARRALWTALGAATGGFIGACAPYAASVDYMPMVFGVMGRTNGVICIAGGLFWAAGLSFWSLRSQRSAALALGVIVFCMTFADWGYATQWVRSWQLQQDILNKLGARVSQIPSADSTVLLDGFPLSLEPGGALVFGAHWDIGSALRLTSGRKDLSADVVPPGIQYLPRQVSLVFDAATTRSYSYGNLFLYNYDGNQLWRLEGPSRRSLVKAL